MPMRAAKHVAAVMVALLPLCAAAEDLSALIRGGDVRGAMAALRAGADVNAKQQDGSTPLLWAVYSVDHELVQALL
jgi:hypothetical protein